MKPTIFKALLLAAGVFFCTHPGHAAETSSSINDEITDTTPDEHYYSDASQQQPTPAVDPNTIWKYSKNLTLAFSTGTIDQKIRFGGEISSRWGLALYAGRNIYLHKKPIGGFLRFGLNLDPNLNYLNFAKGHGNMSDLKNGGYDYEDDYDYDEDHGAGASLGRHFLTVGVAVGPSASFAPFFATNNKNLAVLRFVPYFNVVPSYAAYFVSDEDDTEVHSAFAFWCQAGLKIQWKRLSVGFEWKGTTAKFKGLTDSILSQFDESYTSAGSYKFDINMYNIMIGFCF